MGDVSRLRFEIPSARPGLYNYVIWCGPCYPGKGGSLIGHPGAKHPRTPRPGPRAYPQVLRIERPRPVAIARILRLASQLWPTELLWR